MIYTTLDNGLEVIVKKNESVGLLALQCWVKVGSVDELPHERGMAHLIEHMLFKGTDKRGVGEIAKEVEANGGDINAYTSFDRTVYYLTLAANKKDLAAELLSDAVCHSTFDAEELTREKEVVVEEIKRALDNPSVLVGREMFSRVFQGCEAERPIIGSEESVRGFSRDDLLTFYHKWYRPENMTIVAVGNFDEEEMLARIQATFGQAKGEPMPVRAVPKRQFPAGLDVKILKGDYSQPRVEMTFEAPELEHPDTIYLDLAAFALGSGEGARLNKSVKEEKRLVSGIGCSVYSPGFGGLFSVSAHPTIEGFYDSIQAAAAELSKFKYSEGISREELAKARANLKTDHFHQEETIEGQARSVGYGLSTSYKTLYDDFYLSVVDRADQAKVNAAFHRWVDESKVIITGMVPEDFEIDEARIKKEFTKGFQSSQPPAGKSPTAKASTKPVLHLPETVELKSGLKLAYRYSPEAKFFNMVACTEGGLRAEKTGRFGSQFAIGRLLARATKKLSADQFTDLTESLGAELSGFSGKDSLGLRLNCLPEFLDQLLPTFFDCILEPVFPADKWEVSQLEILQQIKAQDDSPSSICFRKLQELLYAQHPYGRPIYGEKSLVESYDEKVLLEEYLQFRDAGPWVISCVTAMEKDQLVELLNQATAEWKPEATKRSFQSDGSQDFLSEPSKTHVDKSREQTHIALGFKGGTWEGDKRYQLDLLHTILGGQGGRLFRNLRDAQSLAYTVAPIVNHGKHPGLFACYIACAPDKKDKAIESLVEELKRISQQEPDAKELEDAKNYLVGSHESDHQRGSSQASTMALMELYGIGAADFLNYSNHITSVPQVSDAARQVFDFERLTQVIVG